ncbi:MAG: RHS repeat protein [Betaproteobacteria bacterium]|nr:RHS repeat protein [Betaproteobacteria bacterium]
MDYASGGPRPLEIRRTYLSTGFPWLINVSAPRFGLGDYWRTPFDQRLVQYAGTSQTTMIAYRSNNAALYFYRSGTSWAGRPEQSESLADVLDGGGAVVERALMLVDNSRETYDLDGRLTSIRGLDGWTQLLAYDAGGRLQTVTDSMGRVLSLHTTPLTDSWRSRRPMGSRSPTRTTRRATWHR